MSALRYHHQRSAHLLIVHKYMNLRLKYDQRGRVQQHCERMDDQQTELEDLKLKFQEFEATRENQRGEIESLNKQ